MYSTVYTAELFLYHIDNRFIETIDCDKSILANTKYMMNMQSIDT